MRRQLELTSSLSPPSGLLCKRTIPGRTAYRTSEPKSPFLPPNPSPSERPTSIELRPPLRYTGTRLRPRDQGFRGRAPVSSGRSGLSPIYQRLNDVFHI